MLAWWRGRGRRARPRGSPWGPGRGLPASPAVWQSARCFRGHSGRASALRPPLLPPAPGPGLPRPAPRAPLPAALSASRCDCRMPSASALVVAVLCLQLACALPGGDGRSYGCGRRGRGGLPDPGGHRAQRPRGKGLSLGTGTRPPWGPHHAWGWQWPQEGLLEGQVLPTGSGPCLCPSLGRVSRAVGPSAWAGDPCTGEWASPGRLGPQQQPHGADGVTRKGRIRGTCPELPPAPWMGGRWHPGTLGRLVWRAAGALGAPGSAPRGVGAASQPSPGHTSPAAPGSPSGHALSAHALAPSAPVA